MWVSRLSGLGWEGLESSPPRAKPLPAEIVLSDIREFQREKKEPLMGEEFGIEDQTEKATQLSQARVAPRRPPAQVNLLAALSSSSSSSTNTNPPRLSCLLLFS